MSDEESNPANGPKRPDFWGSAKRTRLVDVARAARVHASTVSRVLSHDRNGRVGAETAERIRAVAAELGYVPNVSAAALKTRASRLIGVIVHDIADPVYPRILNGIEGRLATAGYMAIVGNTGFDVEAETDMFERMSARLVDGVILGTTRLRDPVVRRADELGVPLVSVLRRSEDPVCAAVVDDCRVGMHALAQAVASAGHRDIGVIAAPQHLSSGKERLESLLEGLAAHGLHVAPDRMVFVPRMTSQEGAAATAQLLNRRNNPPSIIMAVNDRVALGALRTLRQAGLRCPQDVSLTGYNETHPLDLIDPPLASVAIDLEGIGAMAADRLLARIETPDLPRKVERILPRLSLRASLGTPTAP
ncbi:MAG: LacI family transcriptional regulator [Nioella sp.]|nr:LacI family transcriptional regulator [Nioella sp.]